jgi:hypothetical protein
MVPATRTTDIEKVTDVLTAGFKDSTLTAFVLRTPESTWPVDSIPEDILRPFMLSSTTKKEALGAELVEAGDYAAAAIWCVLLTIFLSASVNYVINGMCGRFPPGVDLPPRPDDDERTLEYRNVWSKIKKEHLQGRRYWYLNMIARHPERREPGKYTLRSALAAH